MRAAELTDDTRLARTGRFGEDGGAEDATQACRHETIKLALKIVSDGQILVCRHAWVAKFGHRY